MLRFQLSNHVLVQTISRACLQALFEALPNRHFQPGKILLARLASGGVLGRGELRPTRWCDRHRPILCISPNLRTGHVPL